ncbi:MAG: T9SS type A sorting domain-containing protein [Flavobacteriales bacterium]|nr:T9SS type A sorting domain-containing protein [Flavobacteriales bacterium]
MVLVPLPPVLAHTLPDLFRSDSFTLRYGHIQSAAPMKLRYAISYSLLALCDTGLSAQGFAELDVNNIRARFYANGIIGLDQPLGQPHFEAPVGSGVNALFSAGLWMGGKDSMNQLHMAVTKYNQTGQDWFPGPLTNSGAASITPAVSAQYDEVWTVNAAEVALYQAYCACLADPGCDESVQFPGYQVPTEFLNWPAHGDIFLDQDFNLAPYYDADGNGQYDAGACDAPCSRGDQSLFFIFNDKLAPHSESGCLPIGVEVQTTPFAYAGPTAALANTVFVQYRIINRSSQTLTDFYVGLFTDLDLGCANDDYIGCDVERSLWYGYNGDAFDEDCNAAPGYGAQPPAFGATILYGVAADHDGTDHVQDSALALFNGYGSGDGVIDNERLGLTHFIWSSNDNSPMGEPMNCGEHYNALRGIWRDGTPLTYDGNGYGGTIPARFAFPGSSDPLGLGTGSVPQPAWSEASGGNAPFDRRGLGSMGPITLEPGATNSILIAFVYARASSGGPEASVLALQDRVDSVRTFAAAQNWYSGMQQGVPCDAISVGHVEDPKPIDPILVLFPVPASDRVMISATAELVGEMIALRDATGRIVATHRLSQGLNVIDIRSLARGVYSCEVRSAKARCTGRVVKE